MQKCGAIFLPAGGYRSQYLLHDTGFQGYYWSSNSYGESDAIHLMFSWDYVLPRNVINVSLGYSVRLVKDV